jgi:LPS-assembly lipoprotein
MSVMVRRLAALAGAALMLGSAGCGFTPLYAQPGVTGGLTHIAVTTPQTRTGYLLREELEDALAIERGAPPVYRLAVQINERRRSRGSNPDDTASRYELRLDLTYTLTEVQGGKVLLKKTKPVFITADATDQPYAGIAAQQDSQRRAASEAATLIRVDVALAVSEASAPR